jgi:hypothetical protein
MHDARSKSWRQDYNQQRPHSSLGLPAARRVCADAVGDEGMRRASARLLEKGTQTPSPAPDLIPAETKNQARTHIAIGAANGGTSPASPSEANRRITRGLKTLSSVVAPWLSCPALVAAELSFAAFVRDPQITALRKPSTTSRHRSE